MNGSLYMGNNGQMYINQDKIRATYGGNGKLMYGDYTLKQLQQRGINKATNGGLRYTGVGGTTNYEKAVKVEAAKAEAKKAAEIKEKKKRQNGDAAAVVRGQKNGTTTSEELKAAALMQMEKFSDSIVTSNNKQILTSAAKVTPINDGNVQLAKSDPKDTAIFAKTGGPFDTLFNDVFGRINDVYNEVHGNTSSDVIPTEPLGKDAIFAESPSISAQSINDGKVQIDPVNIKIDGKLELTGSNGQTVDIISELNNNPMLLRAISDMIVQNISTKYYGGRPVGNSNFRK